MKCQCGGGDDFGREALTMKAVGNGNSLLNLEKRSVVGSGFANHTS